jgi:hypothetical protein
MSRRSFWVGSPKAMPLIAFFRFKASPLGFDIPWLVPRAFEPVSMTSNRVSGTKFRILKIRDRRLGVEIGPTSRKLKKIAHQRPPDLLPTGRNVVGISEYQTRHTETALAG